MPDLPDLKTDRYAEIDLALDVRQAMARLPMAHREILALRYLCDLPPAEIAELLSCNSTAVTSRLDRAKHAFAQARRRGMGP